MSIGRIRACFILLAALLLIPLGLLLQRTFESMAMERGARHRAVSDRVFDELERSLTEILRDEERRPAAHYGFYIDAASTRSPLNELPQRPFVLGYFQIDGEGKVTSPHRPTDEAAARNRGDWSESTRVTERLFRIESVLEGLRTVRSEKEESIDTRVAQSPGSTQTLQEVGMLAKRKVKRSEADLPAANEAEDSSLYSALEQLNLGLKSRRSVQREEMAYEAAPSLARSPSPAADELLAAAEPMAEKAEERLSFRGPLGPAPMTATRVDGQHLLLHRSLPSPGGGYLQQGMLIDLGELTGWLRQRVLGESELGSLVEIRFDGIDAPDSGRSLYSSAIPSASFIYQHRFAEPFEALRATLRLAPLPGEPGLRYVYAIALLLVLTSTLGLWAVYRMVAIAMSFAIRRSNFASAVSHELKTPLTSIRMYGEMLRDGIVLEEGRRLEYYETITSEAERLTRLIDNVLEFSRLERGQRRLDTLRQPLGPLIEEVSRILTPHARAQEFRLELELEAGLPAVQFDRDAVAQILFNLVDNALKYARDAQRKEVVIRVAREGAAIGLSVTDFGPGVPREQLPHVFDAFYRGEQELTRKNKGTGIGLALVKGLCEEMGLEISARNRPEGGFEVTLHFPIG